MTVHYEKDPCGGKGTIIPNPCPKCKGTGRIRRPVSIEVNIPEPHICSKLNEPA